MTVYVDDVVAWLRGREWLVQSGFMPRYHAVLCDPPYFLGSITKRFGKPGSAPAQYGTDGAFQRASRGFMGQTWDGFESPWHYQEWVTEWATLLLSFVCPGAVMLAFGGTRTYHRLTAGLEDAGWEIADSLLYWGYGSGFPKSHDISKALDREARGNLSRLKIRHFREVRQWSRERLGIACEFADAAKTIWDWEVGGHNPSDANWNKARAVMEVTPEEEAEFERKILQYGFRIRKESMVQIAGTSNGNYPITAPATPLAAQWDGYGTALKPAYEPCILARAPRSGYTYAALAREFGTGAINVDGGRIQFANNEPYSIDERCRPNTRGTKRKPSVVDYVHEIAAVNVSHFGRWPANLILGCACESAEHDADCPVRLLGEQSGERAGSPTEWTRGKSHKFNGATYNGGKVYRGEETMTGYGDSGTAARFFYTAKAAAWEREAGLVGEAKARGSQFGNDGARPHTAADYRYETLRRNAHPTVKPIRLTEYLARLILPPALPQPRRLLVPFAGSGSEMIGAHLAGWDVVDGIEQSAEYAAIACARLAWWAQFSSYEQARSAAGADEREAAERETARKLGVEQLGLFDGGGDTW